MKRAKIGDVEFDVIKSEDLTHDAEVTDKPVEKGMDISDHTKRKPLTLSITGIMVGDNALQKLQRLYKYQNEGELLKYVGRTTHINMVIENIHTTHNSSVANGYSFQMSIKQVNISTSKTVNIVVNPKTGKVNPKTNTQIRKKTNKGKQQVRRR